MGLTTMLLLTACCSAWAAPTGDGSVSVAVPAWEPAEPMLEQFTDLPATEVTEPSTTEASTPAEPGCSPCRPSSCPRTALECAAGAGLAADPCGCCPDGVCGLPEGSRCYNKSLVDLSERALGVCGDNMDCLARSDLSHADKPESLCTCRDAGQVCGSDNKTYSSACQMSVASRGPPLQGPSGPPVRVWLKHAGPCRSVPWIVTPPATSNYAVGSPVSLECEVKGYPAPSASWERINRDGIAIPLPGDDASLAVMLRGGPEPFMATTWLQIMALREEDAGTYICVASNSEGAARVAADIAISAD